ncbi:MAG: hypothetical protein LBC81_03775 [Tannerellaceae bacterium]|jgi:hypothetical protein|nr:hypothetical protein [Tannerellaceae bacterium]
MKKVFSLFILLTLCCTACLEEQVPAKYFAGTIWGAFETGGVYDGDNKLISVYINAHILTLNETSFTHVIYRKEADTGSVGYADKDTTYTEGAYTIRYPNITLNYGKMERTGTVEWGTLNLNIDGGERVLQFVKNTTAGAQ